MEEEDLFAPLSQMLRLLLPHLQLVLLFALSAADWSVPLLNNVKPQFLLMAIYYWALYRPTIISPAFAFAYGIALDLLASNPVGITAILLITFQWLVRDQRTFLMGQSFLVIWSALAVISIMYEIMQWGLYALFTLSIPAWENSAYSALISILIFPLISLLLNLTHRLLPVDKKQRT